MTPPGDYQFSNGDEEVKILRLSARSPVRSNRPSAIDAHALWDYRVLDPRGTLVEQRQQLIVHAPIEKIRRLLGSARQNRAWPRTATAGLRRVSATSVEQALTWQSAIR